MTIKYREEKVCRFCHTELGIDVLDLGSLYPSNFSTKTPDEANKVPLELVVCRHCNLVQLKHTVDRDELYRQYWYRSALNSSMVVALQDVVDYAKTFLPGMSGVTVDIGCNDGTMLSLYPKDVITIGIDPAKNLAEEAKANCNHFINDYFTAEAYFKYGLPRANIITAIAMFYDLNDVSDFILDVSAILERDGVFIIQFTDLTTTLKINAIDNICHEHLEYYSLHMIRDIAMSHGLKLIDATYNEVNGGSVRATLARNSVYDVRSSVPTALANEMEYFQHDNMKKFSDRAEKIKDIVVDCINHLNSHMQTVAVMGASTKGNTLLQYYGLGAENFVHAAEINEEKFGLKTVGTGIPIISEEKSIASKPDYYFVLPWHFIDNFTEIHFDYLKDGGTFIVPLPEPRMYYYDIGSQEIISKLIEPATIVDWI